MRDYNSSNTIISNRNSLKKKVIVGMSGGVDSSVSAFLLKNEGYHVEGLFMKNWEEDDCKKDCNANVDLLDTKLVCKKLKIKLHIVNFSLEYWKYVFKNFLSEYRIGRTPNPDILCNKKIKFKKFLEFSIKKLNANYIATGHYVRKKKISNKIQLLRGIDHEKDQSYFLYTLSYNQLLYCIFPLGNLIKSEVRKIAKKINLPVANKRDSTGICFIGKKKFRNFLSKYIPERPGKILSIFGKEVGTHNGVAYYTIGQRKGLNIGGKSNNNKPWYVVDKDLKKNYIIVAQGKDHPKLFSIAITVSNIHWISGKCPKNNLRYTAKVRYRHVDVSCKIKLVTDKILNVFFDKPVIAVPGQSIVFYSGQNCLGGGIIENRKIV